MPNTKSSNSGHSNTSRPVAPLNPIKAITARIGTATPWFRCNMLSMKRKSSAHPNIDTGGMTGTISASELFSETLRSIPSKARRILRDLNRSVWNGSVSKSGMEKGDAAGFAKTLLKEISATGVRTKDIFDASIENLHQTVITSLLHSNQSQAALAIDIMDRNLYERANDCRWWAVNPIFAKLLAQDRCTEDDAKTIGAILRLLVQYLALRHAPERPAVITTTTAAALNLLRTAGLLSRPDFDSLAGAHSFYGDVMQATRAACVAGPLPGTISKAFAADLPPMLGNASLRAVEAELCQLQAGVKNVFGRLTGARGA